MAVDANLLAQLRQMEADNQIPDTDDTSALESTAMVIAYGVALAREAGIDEVDTVETVLVDVAMDREALRSDATLLKALGYHDVAAMLRRLARKAEPAPPKRPNAWHWRLTATDAEIARSHRRVR